MERIGRARRAVATGSGGGSGRRGCRGSSLVETLVALPVLLLVSLGAVQWALIYEAKANLEYAALMAARAGAVEHADADAIRKGLARGLLGLYSPPKNLAGAVRTLRTRVLPDVTDYTRIRILNPTVDAFDDFAEPNREGIVELPNLDLHLRPTDRGAASGLNIQDANLLKVEVLYGHELKVPLVGPLIAGLAQWWQRDADARRMLADRRLPILASAVVRLQSPARRNDLMVRRDGSTPGRDLAGGGSGPGAGAGDPTEPGIGQGGTPQASAGGIFRNWSPVHRNWQPPRPDTGTARPGSQPGTNPGDDREPAANPDPTAQGEPESDCESYYRDGWWGWVRNAWDFVRGVAAGMGQQVSDLLSLFSGDGLASLGALMDAILADPHGTLKLIAEEIGAEYRHLIGCGPLEHGRLVGENINPAVLVKLATRLARYGGKLEDTLSAARKRDGDCASFIAGTPVWLDADTAEPIEKLSRGRAVASRHPENFRDSLQPIVRTFSRTASEHLQIRTESGDVHLTAEHPVWVQGQGWIEAQDLKRRDVIVTRTDDALVLGVLRVPEPATVYNFEVADTHSYFAGEPQLWVHNAACDPGRRLPEIELPELPQGFTYRPDLLHHIIRGEGFKRSQNGVSGAHNMDYFLEHSDKFEDITRVRTDKRAPGIEEISYTWRTASGKLKGPEKKTVYNPKMISDEEFAANVQTALEKAVAQGLDNGANDIVVGKTIYRVGIKDGVVRTVHPILPD